MIPRFYPESDGEPRSHYVVDRYADPTGDRRCTDVANRKTSRDLAEQWNATPPWPAWDTIQEARDHPSAPHSGNLCCVCGEELPYTTLLDSAGEMLDIKAVVLNCGKYAHRTCQ